MKTVRMEKYDSDGLAYEIVVGSIRTIYRAAMNEIRFARWTGDKMPIIKISDATLDRYIGGIIAVENIYKFCTGQYTK